MDKLEEVKKILDKYLIESNTAYRECATIIKSTKYAKQICSLFQPKPDESRLLSDGEIYKISAKRANEGEPIDASYVLATSLEVRDLTASLVRAECEQECKDRRSLEQFSGENYYRKELEKVRAKTIKEVGEWLMKHRKQTPNDYTHYYWEIWMSEVEALKKGEMPDG